MFLVETRLGARLSSMVLKHPAVVGHIQKLAQAAACGLGVGYESLVTHFVVAIRFQAASCLATEAHIPFPPHGQSHYWIFVPCGEAARLDRFTLGVSLLPHGQAHIASVANDVNEFRLWPKLVQGREAPHVTWRLIADKRLAA